MEFILMSSIMFGNLRIKNLCSDAVEACLKIRAVYADREYIDIRFDDVYYHQFDKKQLGSTILFAQELSFNELLNLSNFNLAEKLLSEFSYADTVFLSKLEQRGYKFYLHYIDENSERLVIAKSCLF